MTSRWESVTFHGAFPRYRGLISPSARNTRREWEVSPPSHHGGCRLELPRVPVRAGPAMRDFGEISPDPWLRHPQWDAGGRAMMLPHGGGRSSRGIARRWRIFCDFVFESSYFLMILDSYCLLTLFIRML